MPSIAIAKPYEAIYIVDPDLGEEQVTAITDRYKNLVEASGGTVDKIDVWERRRLAYQIKGRTEGIYVVMTFTGEPKVEAELRRIFQISEDQLRAMIVKPEEMTDAPPQAAAPEAASVPRAQAAVAQAPTAPADEASSALEDAPDAIEAEAAEPVPAA